MPLPEEYWPCPLTIECLMVAHGQGRILHERAYRALENSGLVQDWPGKPGYVITTPRRRKFVEMLEAVPLPVQRWVDPRTLADTGNTQESWENSFIAGSPDTPTEPGTETGSQSEGL